MAAHVDIECIVVGGGVIGLATARALAIAGREVFLLEAEQGVGRGISSRHSEIIHAGLYYPPGSLKARFCVAGKQALYAFCEERSVPYDRCGKIIVATNETQHVRLRQLQSQAEACGVDDLRQLSCNELKSLEPDLCGSAGLYSPSTGIVDSHALMDVLANDVVSQGGQIVLSTPVTAGKFCDEGAVQLVTGGASPATITARHVVLAAGLFTSKIAGSIQGLAPGSVPRTFFAKGNYFALGATAPFSRLIYPMPEAGGLGIHFTRDLEGRGRFGPDVEWLAIEDPEKIDYRVDDALRPQFAAAIRNYWPQLNEDDLKPSYAGVRPKLVDKGQPDADFMLQTFESHRVPGLIVLYGMESPGLTSALAIAADIVTIVDRTEAARSRL